MGVWLEINVELLDEKFYTAEQIGKEFKTLINSGKGKHSRHIPGCEGGVDERIAVEAIGEVLAVTQTDKKMKLCSEFTELVLEQIAEWRLRLASEA